MHRLSTTALLNTFHPAANTGTNMGPTQRVPTGPIKLDRLTRAVQNHIDDANAYLENALKLPVASSDPADALAGERQLKTAQIHALLADGAKEEWPEMLSEIAQLA